MGRFINTILPLNTASLTSPPPHPVNAVPIKCVVFITLLFLVFLFNTFGILMIVYFLHINIPDSINVFGLIRYYTQKLITSKLLTQFYNTTYSGYYTEPEYKHLIKQSNSVINVRDFLLAYNNFTDFDSISDAGDNVVAQINAHNSKSVYYFNLCLHGMLWLSAVNGLITLFCFVKIQFNALKNTLSLIESLYYSLQTWGFASFTIDSNFVITSWNTVMEQLTGFPEESVLHQSVHNIFSHNQTDVKNIINHNYDDGLQIKTKTGNNISLIFNCLALPNGSFLCVTTNVTNLLHTNESKNNSAWESTLIKLFDDIESAYAWRYRYNLTDSTLSGFTAISEGCFNITGMTSTEMKSNLNALEILLTDQSFEKFKNIMGGFHSKQYTKHMGDYVLRSGKTVTVNVILQNTSTEFIDFVGLTTLTHHKQELDLIIASSKDLIMLDDAAVSPKILFASDAWKCFGFSKCPIGSYLHEYTDNAVIDNFQNQIQKLTEETGDWERIMFHGKMNGIAVESVLSKMGNKVLSITRDITDRVKRYEAEKNLAIQTTASRKDTEANQFIKHEVKNGLFSAIGQINSLKEMHISAVTSKDILSTDYQSDILKRLAEVSKDLHSTLQTVLSEAMAKDIVNNQYTPKKEKVDLMCTINRLKNDRYKWIFHPTHIPCIISDEELLFYILRNALSNANKYGKEWSEIFVSITLAQQKLKIRVENTPGRAHEDLLKLPNPNIIFDKGVTLHRELESNSNLRSASAGDGAWIMQTCAKLCGGSCNIRFLEKKNHF